MEMIIDYNDDVKCEQLNSCNVRKL